MPPSLKVSRICELERAPARASVGWYSRAQNPDFYLAHFDLTGKTGNITTAVGTSGLSILMDTFVRNP